MDRGSTLKSREAGSQGQAIFWSWCQPSSKRHPFSLSNVWKVFIDSQKDGWMAEWTMDDTTLIHRRKRKEEDREWCYWTGWWKRITASRRRKLEIVANGAIGCTNLPRKAENQEEEEGITI